MDLLLPSEKIEHVSYSKNGCYKAPMCKVHLSFRTALERKYKIGIRVLTPRNDSFSDTTTQDPILSTTTSSELNKDMKKGTLHYVSF